MPLNPTGAKTTLGNLFKSPVDNEADARVAWGNAIETLTTAIVPMSTTVAAATATLKTALTGFNSSNQAKTKLDSALIAFASTVGGGMSGTHSATPPVAPTGITFPEQSDAQTAADAIIDAINTWLKTGTATPNGGGPVVFWS